MKKIIIAAKADNDVIGKENDLPWRLPADLVFFREQIKEGFLLTGRASYESPQGHEIFSKRKDVIILTRREGYQNTAALIAHDIGEAFRMAETAGAARLLILGGAEVYRQTIALADELIITEVHAKFDGDRFFPGIDPEVWQEVNREFHQRDEKNPYDYSFVRYHRRLI